jgi:hypothetical protein
LVKGRLSHGCEGLLDQDLQQDLEEAVHEKVISEDICNPSVGCPDDLDPPAFSSAKC